MLIWTGSGFMFDVFLLLLTITPQKYRKHFVQSILNEVKVLKMGMDPVSFSDTCFLIGGVEGNCGEGGHGTRHAPWQHSGRVLVVGRQAGQGGERGGESCSPDRSGGRGNTDRRMRMRALSGLILLLVTAGCLDITPPAGSLPAGDAVVLIGDLRAAVDSTARAGINRAIPDAKEDVGDSTVVRWVGPFEKSVPCGLGGSRRLVLTVAEYARDTVTGGAGFSGKGTLSHLNCTFETVFQAEATSLTVSGAPDLSIWFATRTGSDGSFLDEYTFRGSINWTAGDGRKGRCPVELDVTIGVDAGTGTYISRYFGNICGNNFDS